MTVFVGNDTRLVVQGITGREGTFHTLRNRAYGTQVVAGVTPGKAGGDVEGIPVFDTVVDAVRETGANASMIFVPPRFAAEAILEAADAGVDLIVCITEGIPVRRHGDGPQLPEGRRRRRSSARTAPASSRPGRRTSASSRARSARRAASDW